MAWSINRSAEGRYIEVVFAGSVLSGELADAVRETLRQAVEHRLVRILADCTQLEGGHTFADLVEVIGEMRDRGLEGRYREAVLLPAKPQVVPLAEFWETACLNRGFIVQLFKDRTAALDWLCTP